MNTVGRPCYRSAALCSVGPVKAAQHRTITLTTRSSPRPPDPRIMPTSLELWDDSTSRWLYNDREQRALRHVDYNVQELISAACASVGATACTEMLKIAEGAFNKVFRLTFNDSQTAIARIPSTHMFGSGVSWSTASEVATLHSMRDIVRLRVPKVLAWGKDATNVVGSPYIILEDIAGVSLHQEWSHPDTRGAPVAKMIRATGDLMARAALVPFMRLGSLYFREDFPSQPPAPLLPEEFRDGYPFVGFEDSSTVGPIADMLWWRPFHDEPGFNRGPWTNIDECIRSAVALERRAVQRHREDPSSLRFTRSKVEDLDEVERLLSKVEAMAPRIDVIFSSLHSPRWSTYGSLVHPDLRAHNFIVATRTEDNILSRMNEPTVIDWQGASILPFLFQAHIPRVIAFEPTIFDQDGNPMVRVDGTEVSPLPDLTQLTSEQRALAEAEHRRASRQARFVEAMSERFPAWKLTLSNDFFPELFRPLFQGVLRACADGPLGLRCLLISIEQIWGDVEMLWGPVPFSFTEQEREAHKEAISRNRIYEAKLEQLMNRLNCADDGRVALGHYETALKELDRAKNEWNEEECYGPFPFEDGRWGMYLR